MNTNHSKTRYLRVSELPVVARVLRDMGYKTSARELRSIDRYVINVARHFEPGYAPDATKIVERVLIALDEER